jgi:hypothetical protein
MVLEKCKHNVHNPYVYCGLKVWGILLGQQGGYIKFLCFCVDGRAEPEKNTGQLHVGLKEKAQCWEK